MKTNVWVWLALPNGLLQVVNVIQVDGLGKLGWIAAACTSVCWVIAEIQRATEAA